jgi:hypothetical protein
MEKVPTWSIISGMLCLVALAGCGNGNDYAWVAPVPAQSPTPPANQVTGGVTDPAGDALHTSYAPATPDIVSIGTAVSGEKVALQIRFTPGTFDRDRDIVTIAVDSDRKATTGLMRYGLGISHYIYLGSTLYGGNASVQRLDSATLRTVTGTAPVTFVTDGMDVTIPLAFLGNVTSFDYRAFVSVLAGNSDSTGSVDAAPDLALAPAPSDGESKNGTLSLGTTTWTSARILQQIVTSNINAPEFGLNRLVRWETPIEVNTGSIARVETALARYEALTGGAVTFRRVSGTPARGVIFVEGSAVAPDGSPGCGNVNNTAGPGTSARFTCDLSGAMTGTYYVHLGSPSCNDATKGNYDSAIAEHELGHVLGILAHFDGFTGDEGLMSPTMFNVMYNIYRNPIGTTADNLNTAVVAVGQFGFY